MGVELRPWQRRLFDIALERSGAAYAFTVVGVSLGRQQSKTTMLLLRIALELQRANSRTLFTSIDRGQAVGKWREICNTLMDSGFAPHIKAMRRGIGEEELTCHNGATFRPVTPSRRAAGRGSSAITLVVLDEASQLRDFGPLAALTPTQLVARSPQFWIASNAGTHPFMDDGLATPWLHYTRLGRDATLDPESTTAWFEWAARVPDPDNFDPLDVSHWYEALPMMREHHPDGTPIVTEAAVAQLLTTLTPDEFMQEVLNIWPTDVHALVIDADDWLACIQRDVEVDGGDLRMAFDVSPNNGSASVSVATYYPAVPTVAVELVEFRGGTSWLVDRVVELAEKWKPPHVTVDATSPAGAFADQIEAKNITIERMTGRDFAGACGMFVTQVEDHALAHMGDQTPLNEAVQGAVKRPYGELWAFNRRKGYDISPLCSAAMAVADALVKPKARVPGVW